MFIYLLEHHDTAYPVEGYGGIQRVNQNLFESLVKLGYEVKLIITDKTSSDYYPGHVIRVPYQRIVDLRNGKIPVTDAIYYGKDTIFHTHTSGENQKFDFTGFQGKWTATCHGDKESAFCDHQIFVSYNQLLQHFKDFHYEMNHKCKNLYVCHNGINTEKLQFVPGPHNKITWFGHLCPAKAPHIAAIFANKIKKPIYFYGNISDDQYFRSTFAPHLSEYVQYCGPVNTEELKSIMFSEASVSLHTAVTQECFAMTILEAQGCGVPVLSLNFGSMLEANYSSDLVCDSLLDMEKKLEASNFNQIYDQQRRRISDWVKLKYSQERMTKAYLNVWRAALNE